MTINHASSPLDIMVIFWHNHHSTKIQCIRTCKTGTVVPHNWHSGATTTSIADNPGGPHGIE